MDESEDLHMDLSNIYLFTTMEGDGESLHPV